GRHKADGVENRAPQRRTEFRILENNLIITQADELRYARQTPVGKADDEGHQHGADQKYQQAQQVGQNEQIADQRLLAPVAVAVSGATTLGGFDSLLGSAQLDFGHRECLNFLTILKERRAAGD